MKNKLFVIILLLFILIAFSERLSREERSMLALEAFEDLDIPLPVNREAVRLGERLLFEVGYGPVKAGFGELSIPTIIDYEGNLCYLIQSRAWTNRTFNVIFPVQDIFQSFWDVDSLYSHYTEKNISEGDYRANMSIRFDQRNNRAISEKYDMETFPRVQDILSSFYYARTLNLEVGDSIPLPNHTDGRNYPVLVVVHRRETVEVPVGKFDCLVVEPILKTPGLFRQRGRIMIWITDDKVKMPVKMVSRIVIGDISADLIEYDEGVVWEP